MNPLAQLLAERALTDSAWLLVLRQYQLGRSAFPDPFQNRAPSDPRPTVGT